MIKEILTEAAIPSQAARFPDPPEIHAVYFDSVATDGADNDPGCITTHDCTVELYAPSIKAGDEAIQRLKARLDAHGLQYTTQGWYWLNSIQRYQEIIEFSHIVKT